MNYRKKYRSNSFYYINRISELHVSLPVLQLFNYISIFLFNTDFLWVCFDEAFAAALLFANPQEFSGFS
jgi:hypothetical protein